MVIEKDLVEEVTQAVLPAPEVSEEEAKPTCLHHWVIETANGPVSWGVCQNCHEGKEFQNSIGDGDRDY
ncbi:MAG: hypothetical protein FI717_06235 [SAR202 cluster bacterium]|nr:hypothetical protein [Chloroflexota bacterium]MQG33884.1 hypothetical protein [SAR202 cluster bacterium]HAA95603.1 hypothetical protein [Dehalococcoidia bacterium]HCP23417.1 hypothetical protein [Dehalococcoidia bacterium]|tara:strand:- start:603 stop:809 length:207 start_codon:yes stop_codon:yes gene_type:complete